MRKPTMDLPNAMAAHPRPPWLKVRMPSGERYADVSEIVHERGLHTVCESASCPNRGECWSAGTATLMILGNICTRSCGFCAVQTGRPTELDLDEPRRVAEATRLMGLRHVVITSVNRDELADGGAAVWAATVRAIREACPGIRIELLVPDFMGHHAAQDVVFAERPDVMGHNTETVPRLYRRVRPQATYARTLEMLHRAHEQGLVTKTGLMLGLGETLDELREVMRDLRAVGCDLLTFGQYLQPTREHLPVVEFVSPETFDLLKHEGMALGFRHVESGPLVRSSYHAERGGDAFFGANELPAMGEGPTLALPSLAGLPTLN